MPVPRKRNRGGQKGNRNAVKANEANNETRRATADDVLDAIEEMKKRNGRLPDFPGFDKDWNDNVKVKWMETYVRLAEVRQ